MESTLCAFLKLPGAAILVQSRRVFRHVPNLLTGGRLVLAGVFFVLLSYYQYQGRGSGSPNLLNIAFIIYLVALFTDFLDGYLARKWKVEGAFGRVVEGMDVVKKIQASHTAATGEYSTETLAPPIRIQKAYRTAP